MTTKPKRTPWNEVEVITLYRLFLQGESLDSVATTLERPKIDITNALEGLNLLTTQNGYYHRVHPTPFAPCPQHQAPSPQSTEPSPQRELTVADLELPIRCVNILTRYGIHTVPQLCERTKTDLLMMAGIGRRSIREIMETLEDRGFKLAPCPKP